MVQKWAPWRENVADGCIPILLLRLLCYYHDGDGRRTRLPSAMAVSYSEVEMELSCLFCREPHALNITDEECVKRRVGFADVILHLRNMKIEIMIEQ